VICGDLPQLAVVKQADVVEICDVTPSFQESKGSSKDFSHFPHQMPKYSGYPHQMPKYSGN
jgi:hypothetical protein